MKKYFFVLLTLFFTTSAFAYQAIVIVLEAPLLKSPDMSSTVLQLIRKGHKVYVPREVAEQNSMPEFIPTFDRAGNRAYIPSRYVKVIFNTTAENNQPITLADHDPTDYRLEEPIPASYPYEDRHFLRASAAVLIGSNAATPYAYNSSFNNQSYGAETGFRISITRKIVFDKYDRFYFGFIGFASSSKNTLSFQNANAAEESRGVLRAGPWLTYDAFKSDKYRLTIGSGFTLNYHRSTVAVQSATEKEERNFTGISLSPLTSTTFLIADIFPNTDFISGVDLSLYLPHTLKTTDEPELPALWGEENQVAQGLKPQVSLFLGVQVKY